MYHTQGGFSFHEVYDLPIYLRQFYINKLVSQRKKENDEIKKQNKKSNSLNIPQNPRFK